MRDLNHLVQTAFKPLVFALSLIPFGYLVYALYSDTVMGTTLLTTDPVQKLDRELGGTSR